MLRNTRRSWVSIVGLFAVVALVAGACGDDDDDDGATADTSTTATAAGGDDTTTSGAATGATGDTATTGATGGDDGAEPVVGGEATILMFNEIQTLDPVRFTASAGSDGQRAFALYGALVGYNPETNVIEPILAESFEPDDAFTTWTLKLRPDLVFSDGTPFDAAAIKVNWERAANPESRSPSIGLVRTVTAMHAVDARTFTFTLAQPNAHFDASLSRSALNYIASPAAIQSGVDLNNQVVGAGPYLLEEWIRDDSIILERNPDWWDAPRPYFDRIILRTVIDNQQRADTVATGGADGMYSNHPRSYQPLLDAGAQRVSVAVSSGQAVVFNMSAGPLGDVRLRQAVARTLDRTQLVETAFGEGTVAATAFAAPDSPWYAPEGDLPELDLAAAQTLVDEMAAETGGDVSVSLLTQARNQLQAEFIQTSLSALDKLDISIETVDDPTLITRVLQGDYQMAMWGFPWLNADPGLYNPLHSGLATNYSRYTNAAVDAALDAARVSDDDAERLESYTTVYEAAVEEMPFLPFRDPDNGYVLVEDILGGQIYEDGILRLDLIGRAA
jgi:peptide/nickel transport system substrate-binding protein